MTETNPPQGNTPGVNPGNTTQVPNTPLALPAPAPDQSTMVDQPADNEGTHDGGVAAEQQRQANLEEERQVHAERGSEPDAQQLPSVEHEGTGPDEEPQESE